MASDDPRDVLDLTIDLSQAAMEAPRHEPDDEVLPLLGDWRIVLESGAFVAAEGFTLERDDTVARMPEFEKRDGVAHYRLGWKT